MPLAGYPSIFNLQEWLAWHARHGQAVTESGPQLRDRFWAYVRAHGGPDFSAQAAAAAPPIPTPAIPDSLTALLTQQAALPDLFNPQRHTGAAQGAAQLEGLGYADPGTATISEQHALNAQGQPGRDIRYFVFRGADGTLYRQAYLAVQNTGAQRGSLYTSGTADEQAAGKQRLDYNRQNILTGIDTGQTNLFNQEAAALAGLSGQYQTGLEQYQQNAPAAVQAQAPPPPLSAQPPIAPSQPSVVVAPMAPRAPAARPRQPRRSGAAGAVTTLLPRTPLRSRRPGPGIYHFH